MDLAFDPQSLLFCLVLSTSVLVRKLFILSGCEEILKVIGETMLKKVSKSTCSPRPGCKYSLSGE